MKHTSQTTTEDFLFTSLITVTDRLADQETRIADLESRLESLERLDVGKEEASIRATDAQWLAATKARDTDKAASFWSDDATIVMPNSPPITGKQTIRAYVAESFKSPDAADFATVQHSFAFSRPKP